MNELVKKIKALKEKRKQIDLNDRESDKLWNAEREIQDCILELMVGMDIDSFEYGGQVWVQHGGEVAAFPAPRRTYATPTNCLRQAVKSLLEIRESLAQEDLSIATEVSYGCIYGQRLKDLKDRFRETDLQSFEHHGVRLEMVDGDVSIEVHK